MFEKMRFTSLKQKYYEHQGGLLAMFLQDCYRLEEEQFQLQHVRSTPGPTTYDTVARRASVDRPSSRPFFACVCVQRRASSQSFTPSGLLDYMDLRTMLTKSSIISLGKLELVVITSCFEINR